MTLSFEDLLTEASRLRRDSLLAAEKTGDGRLLVFKGADHVAVRQWVALEQSSGPLLRVAMCRTPTGALSVSVAPLVPGRASHELLTELAGE